MKTIKQLAEEIGVSKTAINKKIDNLGLRKQLSKVGGKWLLPQNVENTIKNEFNRKPKSQTVASNQSETVCGLVSAFERQLEAKDKQIEALQSLLDHEQQLHAMTQQKLISIQDKFLALDKKNQSIKDTDEAKKGTKKLWQFWKK